MIKTGAALIFILTLAMQARSEIVWHWQGSFTFEERAKLMSWAEQTHAGVEKTAGSFPFDVHIYFHHAGKSREPVPWAHTERSRIQGVHFHVDPSYSVEEFLADWTAPHEISHLILPYVGSQMRWFSEGFASYMQYQVMKTMAVLDKQQVEKKYRSHISRAQRRYPYENQAFAKSANKLFERRQYPTLYWGGASYFLQVDRALKEKGTSFIEVLAEYLNCCRMQTRSFQHLIATLDKQSSTKIFSEKLSDMKTKPGFPEYYRFK